MSTESSNVTSSTGGDRWSIRVYAELRRLAADKLAREPAGTLQATALVHDAWLRMQDDDARWQNRAHFFGAAAEGYRTARR